MRIADVNLLIYAVNIDAPQHEAASRWLRARLDGDETFGLPWAVIVGFLRMVTNRRLFATPLDPETATTMVDEWLACPAVAVVAPGDRHWSILRALLDDAGTAGNLTNDAHLAALAIEHGAELESADADFGRFRGLRWSNPLITR